MKYRTFDKEYELSVIWYNTNYKTGTEIIELVDNEVIVDIRILINENECLIGFIDVVSKTNNDIDEVLKRFDFNSIDDFNDDIRSRLEDFNDEVEYIKNGITRKLYNKVSFIE